MRLSFLFILCPLLASAQSVGVAWFRTQLYPALEKANCRTCHVADGVAGPTQLHFPDSDATDAEVEMFGLSLFRLVNRDAPLDSPIYTKPTNRLKHSGGMRIAQGSAEDTLLRQWVEYLAKLTPEEQKRLLPPLPKRAPPSPQEKLRRLTHSQYNNTIRDLLGDGSNPAAQFPPEDFVNGFKNQMQGQSLSPLLAENYSAAAERLAANAVRRQAAEIQFGNQFVAKFGRRVFRRPLEPEELGRYNKLFAKAGVQSVIEAMLQSPQFLFRLEATTNTKWQPYVRASRLSYFLWDTTPSDALLDAAARGELNSAQSMEKMARRMIDDPRAKQGVNEFLAEWLRLDRTEGQLKDRRIFPMFSRELALAMNEETRRFLSYLIWEDRNFMEFVTADYSFLNTDLAALYKVKAPEEPFARVQFPPDALRSGILTHASVLTQTSKPIDTSPTARGLFVREQLLCQHVPQPPPGVNTSLPEPTEEKPLTHRDRLSIHLANESCASCHRLIDPIGYGLEHFDAVGAYQEKFKVVIADNRGGRPLKTVELPIDTKGLIAGLKNSDFSDPRRMGQILSESPACQECVAKQVFRYAMGRVEARADRAVLEQVTADFRKSQFNFKELMISVMTRSEFPAREVAQQ